MKNYQILVFRKKRNIISMYFESEGEARKVFDSIEVDNKKTIVVLLFDSKGIIQQIDKKEYL